MNDWLNDAREEAEKTANYILDIIEAESTKLCVDFDWYLNEVIKNLRTTRGEEK